MDIKRQQPLDALVVGAGLAGLGAAALLADAGASTLVLERRPIVGGRAMVVRQEGFALNYGLHYLMGGTRSPHFRLLRRIGIADKVATRPMQVQLAFRQRYGRLHTVPTTAPALLQSGLLSRRAKWQLTGAMVAIMRARLDNLWYVPLGEWLDRNVGDDPTLRAFLLDTAQVLTFEVDPALLSAAHFIREFRAILSRPGPPAVYPVGGWDAITNALQEYVDACGGQVQTRAHVRRLAVEHGRVAGVETDSGVIRARTVVLAIPPAELATLLDASPVAGLTPDRVRAIRPTSGIAVDVGFRGLDSRAVATMELPGDAATAGCHSQFEPSLAPADGHLWQLLAFRNADDLAGREDVSRVEEMFLERIESVWPGARNNLVLRRALVRPVLTGASHRFDQPAPSLLPIEVRDTPGLLIAGDATNAPGELSAPAAESAMLAADAALSYLRTGQRATPAAARPHAA
jgi:phytoene dehydrogenase-like protein